MTLQRVSVGLVAEVRQEQAQVSAIDSAILVEIGSRRGGAEVDHEQTEVFPIDEPVPIDIGGVCEIGRVVERHDGGLRGPHRALGDQEDHGVVFDAGLA